MQEMRAGSCGNEHGHLDSIKCAELLYDLKTCRQLKKEELNLKKHDS
jgi:hypothetical protein